MKAIWLKDQALSLRTDVPRPRPAPGEALVRVLRAGICSTDLELTRGYYPYDGILGHEFVGVTEDGPPDLLGRRVVGEINLACGACPTCQAGRRTHCSARRVLGIAGRAGAFAEYLTLPVENLHLLPEGVTDDAAVFTEPLAAALQIQEQVAVRPRDRVLVIGDGKLGQLVAQTLALCACEVVAAGHHRDKLALLSARGVRTLGPGAPPEPPGGFDVAVECTGDASGFERALRALRPGGTLVLKSTYVGPLLLKAATLVVNEITVVGSRCGPFGPALRLLAEGRVDVAPLVQARYPLERGLAALEHAGQAGALKVLLTMADTEPLAG